MAAIHPKLPTSPTTIAGCSSRGSSSSISAGMRDSWRPRRTDPARQFLRLPALAEMVKIDLERQWQRGRQVSLKSYLKEFPELGSPSDVSADLIQAEYEVRRESGDPSPSKTTSAASHTRPRN